MPGNSKTVYSALISITQFNFVPEEYVEYFFIWNYFSSDHSTNKRMLQREAPVEKPSATKALLAMSDIGYEADLTVENLQTLYLLILLYLIMLLIFGVTFALKVYKPEKYTKAFLKLQGKLFWNFLFRFTLESYLEMAICCLINTRFGPWNREASLHEQVSLGYAFILLILLVAFPMYIAYFSIKTPLDRLYNDKSLKGRKGSIYEGLKLKNKIGLPYNIVFCVRRMVFAVILIYLSDYVWLQLQLNYVISTLMIMFIGFQKPWDI